MRISYKVYVVVFFAIVFVGATCHSAVARDNVTDWYIKDFHATIVVNKDASLDITERITADCGQATGKHGIFRIVPTSVKVDGRGTIAVPVTLHSITDENGTAYRHTTSRDNINQTVTWKIGDPDVTVTGEHTYVIQYTVKNTVRFWNDDFDELYWNLTGNFWDMEMDAARVDVVLPQELTQGNTAVEMYSGPQSAQDNAFGTFLWTADHTVTFTATRMLPQRHGMTASLTFPKGIFTPYQPTLWDRMWQIVLLVIPIVVFGVCYRLWRKHGADPRFSKTVIAHYEPPQDLSLLEMGFVMTKGVMQHRFITASLISFASRGMLTITEQPHKTVSIMSSKDYELRRTRSEAEKTLTPAERKILDKVFEKGDVVLLSSLKNTFYTVLAGVTKDVHMQLKQKQLVSPEGITYRTAMLIIAGIIGISGMIVSSAFGGLRAMLSLLVSAGIIFAFSWIMPKRMEEGAKMNWHIEGFKLFMETVDKDRARFYEDQNIFEKFLPYAVLFNITKKWITRMKEIYGAEYIAQHAPAWYVGATPGAFDADHFSSAMTSLSQSIGASTSSPSGSGGSGSSGGGGGGGGGGGW